MNAKSFYYYPILALILISGINSSSYEIQEIVNENHELPKICKLKDGGVLSSLQKVLKNVKYLN